MASNCHITHKSFSDHKEWVQRDTFSSCLNPLVSTLSSIQPTPISLQWNFISSVSVQRVCLTGKPQFLQHVCPWYLYSTLGWLRSNLSSIYLQKLCATGRVHVRASLQEFPSLSVSVSQLSCYIMMLKLPCWAKSWDGRQFGRRERDEEVLWQIDHEQNKATSFSWVFWNLKCQRSYKGRRVHMHELNSWMDLVVLG